MFPTLCGDRTAGAILFRGKRIALFTPPRERGFDWQSRLVQVFLPPECNTCAAEPRLVLHIRFDFSSIIRCRSTHLVGSNLISVYRGTPQCGERQQCRIPQAVCRRSMSLAPHDSKGRLRVVTTCRRFMAKPCTPHLIAQRVQLFELQTANVKFLSGDLKGDTLF